MQTKNLIILILCTFAKIFAAAVIEVPLETIDIHSRSLPFPSCLLGRDDIYSQSTEVDRTFRKLRLTGDFEIQNKTTKEATIRFTAYQTEAESAQIDIVVPACGLATAPKALRYSSVAFGETPDQFLDICQTSIGFTLSIENEPALVFPRVLPAFSFVPDCHAIAEFMPPAVGDQLKKDFVEKLLKLDPKESDAEKARIFCGNARFKEFCNKLLEERINPYDFFLKRDELYEKFKPEKLLEVASLPLTPRIPLNLFTIWVTGPDTPVEPDEGMIDFALTTSKNNSPAEGWQHYFVTNDKTLLPRTMAKLEGSLIKVIELSDTLLGMEEWALKDEIFTTMTARKFGLATDMIRVQVINKLGGGYLDIDLEVFQSLKTYFFLYDSLWGNEEGTNWICNAWFAARPGHPVLSEYIKLIKRNLNPSTQPRYIATEGHKNWRTIYQTGPLAAALAVYHGTGREGNNDIVMPYQVFFPMGSTKDSWCPRPGDPTHLESASAHYYMGTWANPEKFKSLG